MNKIINKIKNILRHFVFMFIRKELTNKNPCVIASNCNGATMLHDLGVQFRSPFVNLYITAKDFIKLLENFEYYMSKELQFEENEKNYPLGKLSDIYIHFIHYANNDEAKLKWDERKKRIDLNNLFILFTDRDGCTDNELHDFDSLPYENKIVFVKEPKKDIKCAFYIRGFENQDSVGICSDYKKLFSLKRYYDDFDFINWFNHGSKLS